MIAGGLIGASGHEVPRCVCNLRFVSLVERIPADMKVFDDEVSGFVIHRSPTRRRLTHAREMLLHHHQDHCIFFHCRDALAYGAFVFFVDKMAFHSMAKRSVVAVAQEVDGREPLS